MIVGVLGALAAPAVGQAPPAAAHRVAEHVPAGFVGMMADGPIFTPGVNLGQQLGRMASSGVQSVRVAFDWNVAQPYATWAGVPSDQRAYFSRAPQGAPTDFQTTDRIVGVAAAHHLSLLPVVVYPPSWDAWPGGRHVQPVHDAPYGGYLKALVLRYGRRGTFWSTHRSIPRRPIIMWQIWNEPDLPYFWDTANFARSYVALLRAAHHAIKQADPNAEVVLASLTGQSWRGLATIYAQGARGLFDVVGENTYAPTPAAVVNLLRHVRQVMDRHGDRAKKLIDTEAGWPSAQGKSSLTLGVATTEAGQATKLAALLPMLAANRTALGLAGFYYYTWMSSDQLGSTTPFAFSGLFRYDLGSHRITPKPAFSAFRHVALQLEGHR
jgi:hypothetical protein